MDFKKSCCYLKFMVILKTIYPMIYMFKHFYSIPFPADSLYLLSSGWSQQ